jgi:two-component system cell cycle sensor histidine kinase/response regulator CckA
LSSDTLSNCILLMEDEELVSSIAMQMLEFIGYNSVLAVDGGEAIDLYQERYSSESPFAGVIMDLTIPNGMGGEQTVQELLKIDSSAKVIVSSGYSDDPAMVKYDDFGFCAAISKPFNIQELTEVLQVFKPQ